MPISAILEIANIYKGQIMSLCKYILTWIVCAVFMLSNTVVVGSTDLQPNLQPNLQFNFQTMQVSYVQVEDSRIFDGLVESKYQSTMSSQTSGQVAEIRFDVNDVVAKDEVIMRLDDTEQQAVFSAAQANVKSAAALLQEAKDEFKRIKNLSNKQLVSQSELDRARSQFEAALAKHGQMQAQLTLAKKQQAYTVLHAPYSGVVVERHVQIGESVQVGQPLLTGFSLADLRVVTTIPSDMVSYVKSLGKAVVSAPNLKDIMISEEGIMVFPYADSRTHSFTVRVELPINTANLYPGSFVKVAFFIGSEPRLLVPETALAKRGEVKGVYVVNTTTHKVSFRYVVTGKPYGRNIEILSGLSEGEFIALQPTAAAIQLKSMVH